MSLLVDIASQALDPAYAEAAARRRATAGGPKRQRPAVVLAGVLVATLVIVIAGVQAHRHAPAADRTRQALVAQVQHRTGAVTDLQRRLDALRRTTTALRDRSLASSAAGARLSHQLSTLELLAGTVAATGPGLRVVVDDAATDSRGGTNRVTDHDLQQLVNALWAAGAEAVAIGPQRLTAESAIRQAGSAVLVNFEPVRPPYTLTAIGDPVSLETSFGSSRAAARMRTYTQIYGLRFRYSRADELTVPPAPGLTLRHAQPATRATGEGP